MLHHDQYYFVLTSAAGAISSVPLVTSTGEATISVHTVSIRVTVISIHTALYVIAELMAVVSLLLTNQYSWCHLQCTPGYRYR